MRISLDQIPMYRGHPPMTRLDEELTHKRLHQYNASHVLCQQAAGNPRLRLHQEILADAVMTDFKNSASPQWNPVKCWKSKSQLLVSRTIHLVLVCVILTDHSCHGSPFNSGVECPLNVVLTMMANPSARENGSLEGWHEVGGGNEMLDTCGYLDTWIPMIASFWKGHDNLKASLIVGRACCSSGHFHLIVLIPGVCWEVTESVEVSPQVSPVLYTYQKQQSFLLVARAGSTTGGKRTRTHSHTQVVTLCHRSHPYSWQPTIKQHKTVWHHVAVRCSYPCRCCFVAEASS